VQLGGFPAAEVSGRLAGHADLLQAIVPWSCFSAEPPGEFRAVLDERVVTGPILVTHSVHDDAAEVPYALAELLAGGSAGSIGRHGAQRTAEAVTAELRPAGGRYGRRPGGPHHLRADRFVAGHSDVRGPEIAHALWSAIAAS
jgi:hypothetical protein